MKRAGSSAGRAALFLALTSIAAIVALVILYSGGDLAPRPTEIATPQPRLKKLETSERQDRIRRAATSPDLGRDIERTEEAVASVEALLASQVAAAEESVFGVPQAWPEDAPSVFQEEVFEMTLDSAVEDCSLHASAVEANCGEPPCIAVFVDPDFGTDAVVSCPAWERTYGGRAPAESRTIRCGERQLSLLMISPAWPEYLRPEDDDASTERIARLAGRRKEITSTACEQFSGWQ